MYLIAGVQRRQQHRGTGWWTVDVFESGFQSARSEESETKRSQNMNKPALWAFQELKLEVSHTHTVTSVAQCGCVRIFLQQLSLVSVAASPLIPLTAFETRALLSQVRICSPVSEVTDEIRMVHLQLLCWHVLTKVLHWTVKEIRHYYKNTTTAGEHKY